jgi:hypothetical protein
MDGRLDDPNSSSAVMAAVMVTNLEMLATVVTNQNFHFLARYHGEGDDEEFIAKMMRKGARLLELAIRDERGVTTKKAPKG